MELVLLNPDSPKAGAKYVAISGFIFPSSYAIEIREETVEQ
jgi:hypothetical protein